MFKVGATVKVYGKRLATVVSVHEKRKNVGIVWHDSGASTFKRMRDCEVVS